MTCEIHAREKIDQLLTQAGWLVQDVKDTNIFAGKGVAIREFSLKSGHGFADYLLYVDGKAAGVIEAKKPGTTLTGGETQSEKNTKGLPDGLPARSTPLPFYYESTVGILAAEIIEDLGEALEQFREIAEDIGVVE